MHLGSSNLLLNIDLPFLPWPVHAAYMHACMLGRMRAGQSERLASETADERETRLGRMRAGQSEMLASETADEREATLERGHTRENAGELITVRGWH